MERIPLPLAGDDTKLIAFITPILVNIVVATVLFYLGFTFIKKPADRGATKA